MMAQAEMTHFPGIGTQLSVTGMLAGDSPAALFATSGTSIAVQSAMALP
jgi:hypothetical protein